jgi:hypothetical protein
VKALARPIHRTIAAGATITGRRFGMLVASSLLATSAIVASALTGAGDGGALAALLGRSLASDNTPAASGPAAEPSLPATRPTGSSAHPAGDPESQLGGPPASASTPSATAGGPKTPTAPKTPATPTTPEAGRIKHVFVISLASPGYEASFGAESQMPYLAETLRPKGNLLSGYSLLDDAALPNSIAAIGGQPPNASTQANCSTFSEFPPSAKLDSKGVLSGSGCLYPVEALTIADQLTSGRFRWRAYMEDMADEAGKPNNCVHPEPGAADEPPLGGYAARLNPFVYFHSLLDLGDCSSSDVPLTELERDLKKVDSTPNYSYISPNLCNSGVAGQCPAGAPEGAASGDAFLSALVPKILASPAYKQDGLLVVTFGEASPPSTVTATAATTATTTSSANPLQVGALLLSRYVPRGATDATAYDPYSLLRTTEDLFGLSHLAKANGAKVGSFAPALLGESGGD